MKQIFLLFFFLLTFTLTHSQHRYGIPPIKIFKPSTYQGHPQCWETIQLFDDRIAIGSSLGMIVYDGNNFEIILKQFIFRSFFKDTINKKLYVGGDGIFGYINYDSTGFIKFTSLSDSLSQENKNFLTITGIHHNNNTTFFSGFKRIFIFKSDTLYKVINPQANGIFLFNANNSLFTYIYGKGIFKITEDSLIFLPNTELFAYRGLNKIISYNDSTLLIAGARPYKFYIYNLNSKKIKEFPTPMTEYFLSKGLNDIIRLKDNNYAVATKRGGIIVLNNKFEPLFFLNKQNGLHENLVTTLYQDNQDNIWGTTSNGFFVVNYKNQSFGITIDQLKLTGIPGVLSRKDNDLFLSTINLTAKLHLNKSFSEKNNFIGIDKDYTIIAKGQVLDIRNISNDILLSSRFGLFQYKDKNLIPIDTSNIYIYIHPSRFYKNLAYAVNVSGLSIIHKNEDKWKVLNNKIDVGSNFFSVFDKSPDTLYLLSGNYGLYKIVFTDTLFKRYKVKKINLDPNIFNNAPLIYMVDDTIFSINSADTTTTLWLDTKKDTFFTWHYKIHYLNNTSSDGIPRGYKYYVFKKDTSYVLGAGKTLTKLKISSDTIYLDNSDFRATKTSGIFNVFYDTIENLIWYLSADYIYNIPIEYKTYKHKFNSIITQVKLANDSVIASNGINPTTILPYKFNEIIFTYAAPFFEKSEEITYSYKLKNFDKKWSSYKKENFTKYTNLPPGKYIFKVKAKNIYKEESNIATFEFTILPPWYMTWWAYVLFAIVGIGIISFIVYLNSRRLKAANERLEKIVKQRTKELIQKNIELDKKNKLITQSIEYAKKIQDAILPTEKELQKIYQNSFLIFFPRDIVSGDFFWFYKISEEEAIVIISDCTGHGVPGAFMSMIGNTLLNEIIKVKKVFEPARILENLHKAIIQSLQTKEHTNTTSDGMDTIVCKINTKNKEIHFASANQNAFFFVDNEFISCYGDPFSIGDPLAKQQNIEYRNFKIKYNKKAMIYLTTDGYFDQFGGENNKKFTINQFIELLKQINELPIDEQKTIFEQKFKEWKNRNQQIDDILIVGIKL